MSRTSNASCLGTKECSDTLFLEVSSQAQFQTDPISLLIHIQNAVRCSHTHPEIPSSEVGGVEKFKHFYRAMHCWIEDTNVLVSYLNPDKIDDDFNHSTEKKYAICFTNISLHPHSLEAAPSTTPKEKKNTHHTSLRNWWSIKHRLPSCGSWKEVVFLPLFPGTAMSI